MADKEILIDGLTVMHGTGVKDGVETSTNTTVCFDEVVTQGSPKVSYTLEIDRLVYETQDDYFDLSKKLKEMLSIPSTITTREVIRYDPKNPFVIVKNFSGCILDSKDYEMKPEENSVQSLKFICSDCVEEPDTLE